MRASVAIALALAAVATLAQPAAAVPTTLFAHTAGPGFTFGLNTQEPDAAFVLDAGPGTTAATLSCVPAFPGGGGSADRHTIDGFVVSAPVAYTAEHPHVSIPPLMGVDAELRFLGSPMLLHWYWSEETAEPAGAPVAAANVVVRATLRATDTIDLDSEAYETGPVVAVGESLPATLAGESSQGVEFDQVGGRTVYHFEVPMEVDVGAVLPRGPALALRVETFVQSPACEDGHVMPPAVRLHSSPGHRPRLELDVSEPLSLPIPMHAQALESELKPTVTTLLLNVLLRDAWGRYDLRSWNATAEGPGLPPTAMEQLPELQTYEHRAAGDFGPLALGFGIDGGGKPFPAGNYTFRFAATTLQGHTRSWEQSFQLGSGPEAPMPGAPWAVAALVAAAAALRRRR